MVAPFDDNFEEMGVTALFDEFAEPTQAIYRAEGAADVNVSVILGNLDRTEEAGVRDGTRDRDRMTAAIPRDSAGPYGGVDDPHETAKIVISSVEWAISRVIQKTGSMTTVEIVRIGVVEHSRPGYREQRR